MPRSQRVVRHLRARSIRSDGASQVWLGVGVAIANVLGYAAIVVISATFGPASFGAVGALTSLGVILGIPAGTIMVIVAGRVGRGESVSWAFGLGTTVGVVEAALLIAASPWLVQVLDLDSIWPLVWLGLTLVPMTLFSAQQGLLLGSHRLGRLALLFGFSGVFRLTAAAVCVSIDPTVGFAYAAWLVAALLAFGLGLAMCVGLPSLAGRTHGLAWHVATLGRASTALLALITLTSIDTIFARHLLSAEDSGIYSVASVFAKIIFWGTQFIAMVTVPKLARTPSRFLILKAYAAVVAVSAPVIAVIAINPRFWLTSVGLDEYAPAGELLTRFALLGVLWSLVQVSTFADMGGTRTRTTSIIWIGLAVQCALTFTVLGSTPAQIWAAATIGALVATGLTLLGIGRRTRAPRHG